MTLEAGTVFRWNKFPYPRYDKEEIKPRWFIYLGDSGIFSQILIAYICTTTTQTQHFEINGHRVSHYSIKFESTPKTPFEEDCILDCDEPPFSIEKKKLENHLDIEIKGKLKEQKLREIYNGIYRSYAYSPVIINNIHESFNKIGITGLKIK